MGVGLGDAVGDGVGDGVGEGVDGGGAIVGVAATVGEGEGLTITIGAHALATNSARTSRLTESP